MGLLRQGVARRLDLGKAPFMSSHQLGGACASGFRAFVTHDREHPSFSANSLCVFACPEANHRCRRVALSSAVSPETMRDCGVG